MHSIDAILDQVRRRLRQARGVQFFSYGLAVGAAAAAVLALLYAATDAVPLWWCIAAPLALGALFAITGRLWPISRAAAAAVVDSYYGLKDRAITAIDFERSSSDPLRRLQLADAADHLRRVEAAQCVPVRGDRRAFASSGVFGCVAAAAILYAHLSRIEIVPAAPLPVALQQASFLRETMLPEIEALKESEDPEIEELARELEQLVEDLEQEALDPRDLMAKLSEMEQSLAEARDSLQLQATDAQLQTIAAALQPAEAMAAAARAIQSDDYEKAGEHLEKVDPQQISDKERRAVADNLKKMLARLSPGQKGELSDAVKELQEGLENQDPSQCKNGMCKLAGLCKQQGAKKKIGECLACQLNRLSECKSQCRGACNSSLAAKTKSPSQSYGTAATGNPNDGDPTELDGARRQEQLDSQHGEGPSESEVIESPEGEQDAVRQYAARYQEFRRQAEAVLETEPLPLGHRETVRQYFESIRPSNAEEAVLQEAVLQENEQ